jgi:hypothetical protein
LKLRIGGFVAAVLLLAILWCGDSALAQSSDEWSFGVSGDSRNCGDMVMPGIAAGVRSDGARFYWHLGDFRANYDFDQDLLSSTEYKNKHLSIFDYQRIEWQDFIAQQLRPFGETPVYLGIGNHELIPPKTRADFLQQFADWLDSPTLRAQRLRDDASDHLLRTYNHWVEGKVDFLSLDNASSDQFDDAQVAWVERVLARDESDEEIRTVVVGMHDALPDSLSAGHSMNESAQMERSGRKVYQDLVAFRSKTKKFVYVLASHSHFLLEDPYNDMCHPKPETVLPGWIVGTAGAVRYRLPVDIGKGKLAKTDVYGYLLGTVQRNGEIHFVFKEITKERLPSEVLQRYDGKQIESCFDENKSPYAPAGPSCPAVAGSN